MALKRLVFFLALSCGAVFAQSAGVTEIPVTFSATPTYTCNAGVNNFTLTITSNVTGGTFTCAANSVGSFKICESGSGFTWAAPSSGVGFGAIDTGSGRCSTQGWKWDGTTLQAVGAMNSQSAPTSALGGYATVDSNGTGVTQRTTVNYISGTNATVACVDNSGANRTDCTVSATSGSSAPVFPPNAQTATYQLLAADFTSFKTVLVSSGTFTITGVASGSQPAGGTGVWIINYGTGVVTFARSGQNINGAAANLTIPAGSASAPNGLFVVSDGTNYFAQPLGVSSASGTVTSVGTNNGLTGGTITSAGTVGLATIANNAALCNNSGGTAVPTTANCTTSGTGALIMGTSPSIATPTLTSPSLGAGSSPLTETWVAGTGGVTANTLVQTDTSAPSKIIASTTGAYGVAMSTQSATANVEVARYGTVNVITDTGGATAGHLGILGTGSAIDIKDSGQTSAALIPFGTSIIGIFRSTATAGNPASVELTPEKKGTRILKSCDIPVGDTSGSAITDSQLGPQSRICYIPTNATILEMDVNADGGTPNVIVGRNHAGTVVNIVSSALATAASGGIACSNTGGTTGNNGATTCSSTLQNTSLSAGDYLELVSGTAGGTAQFFVVHVLYY